MKIGVGADSFGLELKEAVKRHVLALGHVCVDLSGTTDEARPYYEVAHEPAGKVGSGEFHRGFLVCGTEIGVAIIANKHQNVYAAVCEDPSAATKARSINHANLLTMVGMVKPAYMAKEIVDPFLTTEFKSGWDEDLPAFLDRSGIDIQRI